MLSINEIIIGQRLRDDLGDLVSLANSIRQRGLLHPIIIDEHKRLIAGHRRLEACKLLEWEEITVRYMPDLSEQEKRLIELEENTKRKDLTPYEQSKNLIAAVETAKEVLKSELLSPEVTKKRGRPETTHSDEKVADMLGTTRKSIHEARQHSRAVERHPVLVDFPKKQAIQAARAPSEVEQYEELLKRIPELSEFTVPLKDRIEHGKIMRAMTQVERDAYMSRFRDSKKRRDERLADATLVGEHTKKIHNLLESALRMHGMVTQDRIDAWVSRRINRKQIEDAIEWLQLGIDELTLLQNGLREALKGPRKVVTNEKIEKAN
ncbi:ParB N-terminal domain-containing protein [Cohnella suwonensis]|uniref:ParB N-terminal domain-containing protein n=1 Tax=Cohnella suwonensis TaxID=696072 RepID=A0ABW0LT38_9BACL